MRYLSIFVLLWICQVSPAQVLVRNVTVVDVEKKKLLAGYDVITADGRIAVVEKTKKDRSTDGLSVIDGTGKFLVPGFTDAHVHFFQSGGLYARPDVIDLRKYRPFDEQLKWVHQHMDDFLRRYSSCGITSVIDVGSSYHFLSQRDSFNRKNDAPLIRMTGPLLTTYVPGPYKELGNESPFAMMLSEDGVRKSVRDQIPLHADFIKIWYIVTDPDLEKGARKNLPLVKAAIDEAHKHNLQVAVHATQRITAQLAVEAGADFLVHSIDDEVISKDFIQLLLKNKTVLCPTLVVMGNYSKVLGHEYHFSTYELEKANPATVATVLDYPQPDTALAANYIKSIQGPMQMAREKKADSIMQVNLKLLVDAGVVIAAGTDAGNIGTQHASSFFLELEAMQAAGMNNWQLLEAATINGAKAIGEENDWGSIAKNKLANMLILDASPLEDLANWQKIDWVINKGYAFPPSSFVKNKPEMLAQEQLNAYNAHNLEAFLAPYADDVEIYQFPNTLQIKGKDAMRKAYQFVAQSKGLYCRLVNRIISGNMVIDQEEVRGLGPDTLKGIAIYYIENGKISKVYFKP
ncbi:MAG: amidohydrolase family protein [Terrimonas sp.]|nr:amidohydrolase family protein [Terrimonas sp.]